MRHTTTHHRPSARPARRLLTGTVILTTALACADDPIGPLQQLVRSSQVAPAAAAERAALTELTRAVAMALGSEGLRQRVKHDMRRSRVTREHKLELASYLKGESGGILLAQMTRATGVGRDSLLALVAAVRPLEFYMAVREQRESWTGGPDLWVASLLHDDDVPAVFDLAGRPIALAAWARPEVPTFSLVPVETDFSRQLDSTRWRNTRDRDGDAIGTLSLEIIEDDGSSGGTSGTSTSTVDGLYLTYADIRDVKEPFLRGDPELETHIHGPRDENNPTWGMDLSCAGEHAYDARRAYDQNGQYFQAGIGRGAPLLFDRTEIQQFQARFPGQAFHILVWEDDDTACEIRTDMNLVKIMQEATEAAGAAGAAILAKTGPKGSVVAGAFAFLVSILKNSASLIKTNDDFVGHVLAAQDSKYSLEASLLGMTHVLMEGTKFNGWVKIESQYATAANGRSYATSIAAASPSVAIDQTGSHQASATVYDQYNAVRSGHFVGWRAANPGVAAVSPSGLIRGVSAGTAVVYARACDPDCLESPIEVKVTGPTLSGPDYAYAEFATFTATVVNARQSSYYYVWEYSPCSTSDCSGWWYPLGADVNLVRQAVYVHPQDSYVRVRVTLKSSQHGVVVGATTATVAGAGETGDGGCDDPTQLICEPW